MTRYDFRYSGFTLVELILVIVIIAIISLVAIPRMISRGGITASLAADLAASDIRAVQQAAMASGSSKTITFGGAEYTAEGLNPAARAFPGPAVAGTFSLTFNSLGEPDQGGSFTVSSGGESKTVTVQAITGTVTIN